MTSNENPSDIFQQYEEISRRTYELGDQTKRLVECEFRIINHIRGLDKRLLDIRYELLIALRLNECINLMRWVRVSIVCGMYEIAIRELRHMYDIMLQAYYIDRNHFQANIECKVEILKALETWDRFMGSNLIDKCGDLQNKKAKKQFYRKLSGFVHGSSRELQQKLNVITGPGSLKRTIREPSFDENMFNKCVELVEQSVDNILEVSTSFASFFQERIPD